MDVDVPFRSPFAGDALLAFLGERTIPGVETYDGRTLRRAIHTTEGRIAMIGLTPEATHVRASVDGAGERGGGSPVVIDRIRRLLDLDTDPTPIDDALAEDPMLRPSVRDTPGVRLPGAIDGFELAVRAVLGQQVSVRAARTFAGRIAAEAGTAVAVNRAATGISHAFPTADQLAEATLDGIGLTGRRKGTLRELARLVADGTIDLSGGADPSLTSERLLAIDGIGPWTVAYIAMRALGDVDAFPASDLGVRAAFERLGQPSAPLAIRQRAERWRPWRGYATMRLWHALGPSSPADP